MLNLLRNVLLNISAQTQADEIDPLFQELIPASFTPLIYSPSVERVRLALLPGVSLNDRAFATSRVLQLLYSRPVQVYLGKIENVFSFSPLGTDDLFNTDQAYDLVEIDGRVEIALSRSKFFREVRRSIPEPEFLGLERIRSSAKGPLDRVAALATMFELHAAHLLGKLRG